MKELISAIEETIKHLEKSDESDWSSLSPKEAIEILEKELKDIIKGREFDKLEIKVLYAPTSNIQEIAMANNWHDEYIDISNVIDKFTESNYLLKYIYGKCEKFFRSFGF